MVIGVSDSSISLISEVTEKDQIDRIRILSDRTPVRADRKVSGFQEYVMKDIGKLIDKVQRIQAPGKADKETTVIDNPAGEHRLFETAEKQIEGFEWF